METFCDKSLQKWYVTFLNETVSMIRREETIQNEKLFQLDQQARATTVVS